jgi:rhamnopyranosyl-N-acetylglucosaminyl-diphospho-decaprenol beta-1,3/1,4-galactofuranosyltransferase
VSAVIVFDNASSDGTAKRLRDEDLLDCPRLRYVRSEVNTGGAGGFANAIALGSETDADWLWLMDDDAEPRQDALERLLASPAANDDGTAALCTAVVHGDGTLDPQHRCRLGTFITPLGPRAYAPGSQTRVDCASFVGLLVRTRVARATGLPRREFFLGYDDAEYSLRLGDHGDVRLVPESVITHKLVIGGGAATLRSTVWNRLLSAHYTPSPWESYWKDLYRIRNFVALKVARGGFSDARLAVVILGYALKTFLYDRQPLRRLPWILRFALKGRRGDFGAPSPEAWSSYARGAGRR